MMAGWRKPASSWNERVAGEKRGRRDSWKDETRTHAKEKVREAEGRGKEKELEQVG